MSLQVDADDFHRKTGGHDLILPYWLPILIFALAPALWWRRRYVERREKKFFEQIVAEKRAERKLKAADDAM